MSKFLHFIGRLFQSVISDNIRRFCEQGNPQIAELLLEHNIFKVAFWS